MALKKIIIYDWGGLSLKYFKLITWNSSNNEKEMEKIKFLPGITSDQIIKAELDF